jgi:hypothetical protein
MQDEAPDTAEGKTQWLVYSAALLCSRVLLWECVREREQAERTDLAP